MNRREERFGYLVVERVNWFSPSVPGGPRAERTPAVPLSHEEILLQYRGIDGWPVEGDEPRGADSEGSLSASGLLSSYSEALERAQSQANPARCDVLLVSRDSVPSRLPNLPAQFDLLGYDFGFLCTASYSYSVVLNEVLYGQYPELRRIASDLNQHLLLPSTTAMQDLIETRARLIAGGADLETLDEGEAPTRVIVFGRPRRAQLS